LVEFFNGERKKQNFINSKDVKKEENKENITYMEEIECSK
jgi:hypothetical protein